MACSSQWPVYDKLVDRPPQYRKKLTPEVMMIIIMMTMTMMMIMIMAIMVRLVRMMMMTMMMTGEHT